MALTLFSSKKTYLPDIRRYELPLAGINQALEHARQQLERGRNGSLDGRRIRLDQRNREIVKAVEEILNVVIPSLQGAAALLEDAVIHPSSRMKESGVEGQVPALKKSIATAVRELHKTFDIKILDSARSVDLPQEAPAAILGEDMEPGRSRLSATRAMASAKRHLQALHLPGGENSASDPKSAKAARIAKTMDEVAFHTNLLTLNAAVESYRLEETLGRDREAPHAPGPPEEKDPEESRQSGEDFTMDPRDWEMLAEFYP